MKAWRVTGLLATIIIVLSVPLYLLRIYVSPLPSPDQKETKSSFVGTLKCADCHRKEFDTWQDSHHDHAMDIASEKTVLGNFDNVVFTSHGATTKFYKKDEKFYVYTKGPKGKFGEYEVKYTFGWFPLQQYIVPFEGGRFQCLPIAWDASKNRWYDLNPEIKLNTNDWLYWTNPGQNWNGMCAECHSTNLKKNYDPAEDNYQTTWTDIDVGCEACHGPGSKHVKWAETPDMGRPDVTDYNLAVRTSGIGSRELVNQCAPCHSRRAILGDYTHAESDLLDSLQPSLLTSELYYPDGQILEEVYVYGSFTQSKMYHRDVKCSDCHDVHSAKLVKEGNDLCLQCHRAGEYDSQEHHFHKQKGEKGDPIMSGDGKILFDVGTGAECMQCHMPGRNYMVIDYRPDHSFRVPRPDLSNKIYTPNACNRCHTDKPVEWSDDWITKWYGPGRKDHYGEIIAAGRNRRPEIYNELLKLATDPLYPVIVRSTALSLLGAYPCEETTKAFKVSLMDEEALIRRTAIENFPIADDEEKVKLIAPFLYDPVKAVRIEAASRLAGKPSEYLDTRQKELYQMVLKEFIASMEYSGDFSFARFNLGNLYQELEDNFKSIENYRAAINIDNLFYPAKVNLAMLYNGMGNQDKAEELFREVIREHPGLYEIYYSLALLMAEKKSYEEAAEYMRIAAANMPDTARVHYNYGLLLQFLKNDQECELEFKKALEIEPQNLDYLYALFDYYFKRSKFNKAKNIAETMVKISPDLPEVRKLLDIVKKRIDLEK